MKKYVLIETGCSCDPPSWSVTDTLASLWEDDLYRVITVDFETCTIERLTEEVAMQDPAYKARVERQRLLARQYTRYLRGEITYKQYQQEVDK